MGNNKSGANLLVRRFQTFHFFFKFIEQLSDLCCRLTSISEIKSETTNEKWLTNQKLLIWPPKSPWTLRILKCLPKLVICPLQTLVQTKISWKKHLLKKLK